MLSQEHFSGLHRLISYTEEKQHRLVSGGNIIELVRYLFLNHFLPNLYSSPSNLKVLIQIFKLYLSIQSIRFSFDSQAMVSPTESNMDPLEVCRSLFHALNFGNYEQMYKYIIPTGHAALRRTDIEGPQIINITLPELLAMAEGLVKSVFDGKNFEETFDDPEVRVDDDLAMVWVKTRLLADGEEVGKGTNVIGLHKMKDGEWKISSITDRGVLSG
jgi:hypothetical protein